MQPATERFPSAPAPTVEELRVVPVFADLPDEDLQWLASVMHVLDVQTNELLARKGDEALYMVALLSGEIRVDLDNGRIFFRAQGAIDRDAAVFADENSSGDDTRRSANARRRTPQGSFP